MLKFIRYFLLFIFVLPSLATADTYYNRFTFIADHFNDKTVYSIKSESDNISLSWYNDIIMDDKSYQYGYNKLLLSYNQFHGEYKFRLYEQNGLYGVIGIEKTNLFCNKEFIVISIGEYREISDDHAENNYYDIFIDTKSKDKTIDQILVYNVLNEDTRGPVTVEVIKNMVKHKCINGKIKFEY